MSENYISRRTFSRAMAGGAVGGLIVESLGAPAFAVGNVDPANRAELNMDQSIRQLKKVGRIVAKHTAQKFADVVEMTGEPRFELAVNHEFSDLFLSSQEVEQLPQFSFAYHYNSKKNSNNLSITEQTTNGRRMFSAMLTLPDGDNIIHDKIVAGRAAEVTAVDAKDVIFSAKRGLVSVQVVTPRFDDGPQVFFDHGEARILTELDYRPATATELTDIADVARKLDNSPAFSLSTPNTI